MAATTTTDPALAVVRARKASRDAADVALLQSVVDWAAAHEITEPEHTIFEEPPLCLAGPGAPMVAEYATYELAAALGMTSDSGALYVGKALELRHRLPKTWERVVAGDVPVWRAFRVAEQTIGLPAAGAAYVDTHLSWRLPHLSFAQQARTVEEALVRFDPATAEELRLKALDGRRFDVWTQSADHTGTVDVTGRLGLTDAFDLENAVAAAATALADAGCTETLDVRRSMALGVLARGDHALDLQQQTRPLVIHLHDHHVGLLQTTRSLVSVDQVAAWCATTTKVTIKPVIDLNRRLTTASYTPTVAIAEHVRLRDRTCVFPRCTRPSTGCDLDHIVAYDAGGPTSTDNLAPLCRRHHRAKTHSAWSYVMVRPGRYRWTSSTGLTFDTRPEP